MTGTRCEYFTSQQFWELCGQLEIALDINIKIETVKW